MKSGRFLVFACMFTIGASSAYAAPDAQMGQMQMQSQAQAQMQTQLSDANSSWTSQITTLAANSSCARYVWKNRGRAPVGYIKGVSLSFARSLCRMHMGDASGVTAVMSAADSGSDARDAITHYRSLLNAHNIPVQAGEVALKAIYTLGFGLGERESSGHYCEGWDTSAGSHRPSSAAEAGPFQVSYDSIGTSSALARLYSEYKTNRKCDLEVFKEGASCHPQSILGTGVGADFQSFTKSCPAFATEYAMTLLRVLRSHFGPINRREAEVRPECNALLGQIQRLVDQDPRNACQELM